MVQNVYILSGARTPIGRFQGSYEKTSAINLGATVIQEVVERAKISPNDVDQVIMGQVLTAGQGQNPARQASLLAELPVTVPAYTINMVCGSGLKVVFLAYQAIRNDDAQIIVCGGQENMTMAEHTAYLRGGAKFGNINFKDSILQEGLVDTHLKMHMGNTAEHLAKIHSVDREAQDQFAASSQNKAEAAIVNGYFKSEITPVRLPRGAVVTDDEFPRKGTTAAALGKLKPAFLHDGNGTVTAGNASGVNDGAAAVVVCSESVVKARGLVPLARIVGFAEAAIENVLMGLGPVPAIEKLLNKIGWTKDDVDLFELNEAFAVQSLLVVDTLGLDKEKVNISGGAIALGHPIGASGTRILVTLMYNLQRLKKRRGVASLCIGGGMGIAVAVEACDEA